MNDETLAKILQEEWNNNSQLHNNQILHNSANNLMNKMGDSSWDLIDPNPDAYALFHEFNKIFFWNKLDGVEMKWSNRMTMCAGICSYEGKGGLCSVRLSKPLLQLRPRKDLLETLLHEMIHAYLFVTDNNRDRDGHGAEFLQHMKRINKQTGLNITVYHSFHDEVDYLKVHWWRCNGPCQNMKPFFGYVKRSMNRAPSSNDLWWDNHKAKCNGTFIKIKEPLKKKKETSTINMDKNTKAIKHAILSPDIRQSILEARSKFLDEFEAKQSASSKNTPSRLITSNSLKSCSNKKSTDIKYWLCNPSSPVGSIIRVNFTSCANAIYKKKIETISKVTVESNSKMYNYNESETDIKSSTDYLKHKNFNVTIDKANDFANKNGLKRLHVFEDKNNFKKVKLADDFYLDSIVQNNTNDEAMVDGIIGRGENWQTEDEMLIAALKISQEEFNILSQQSTDTDLSKLYIPVNENNLTNFISNNGVGNSNLQNINMNSNGEDFNIVTNDFTNGTNTLEVTDILDIQEDFVRCPVCAIQVSLNLINEHLDSCIC